MILSCDNFYFWDISKIKMQMTIPYIKNMKKILYIKAQWMGDIISSIPKWEAEKNKGNKVYLLYYDFRYFGLFLYKTDYVQDLIKENQIVKDILYIPYGKIDLLLFFIKNFRAFDEVIIPIKTKWNTILGIFLGKKYQHIFSSLNDIKKYKNVVAGELENKELPMYNYKKSFIIPKSTPEWMKDEVEKIKYITIFPSSFERSIESKEWNKIIKHITNKWIGVIFVWWEREKYILQDIDPSLLSNNLIKNALGKTSLNELAYLLENSILNISCNGGVMWLWHLMNPRNISIQTVSSFTMEPPVDNIFSFNLRMYTYPECKPCEAGMYRFDGVKWIPCCKFYNTKREWECRFIKGKIIIDTIEKIISRM